MLKSRQTAVLAALFGSLLVMQQGMAMGCSTGRCDPNSGQGSAGGQSSGTSGQGVVHFRGVIVSSTCTVSSSDADKTVQLGQWPTTDFPSSGSNTSSVSFQINLTNCPSSDQYTLRFDGPTPTGQPNLLAVSDQTSYTPAGGSAADYPNDPAAPSGVSGIASGVGIEILDNNNQVVPIGQNSCCHNGPGWQSADSSGNVVFNLKAHYKSYQNSVTAGLANADATFTIEYQ